MQRSTRFTLSAGSIALASFVFSLTALNAGQGPPPQAPPAGTPPKPLVPVAASSVAANPDPYVGEFVTMTGAVEANLSKTSFSVDQDKTKPTGKDVLVLAPNLQKPAEANGYVTVIGQLIKFDEKEVAEKLKDYKIDLSPEDLAKFRGKPVVLATAVINTAGIDIAKKPIPAMSADELALQKIMTKLPPAQAALRKALDGKDLDLVKEQATHPEDLVHRDRGVLEGQGQHRRDDDRRRGQEACGRDPDQPRSRQSRGREDLHYSTWRHLRHPVTANTGSAWTTARSGSKLLVS